MTIEDLYRHHEGYFDDVEGVLEFMKPLGNYRFATIAREFFVNRRSTKALAERHHLKLSTIQNMIRNAVERLEVMNNV